MDNQQQTKVWDPRGFLSTFEDIWLGYHDFLSYGDCDAGESNLGYHVY